MASTNDQGQVGKIIAEKVFASNAQDAERIAYGLLSPFLSAWSLNFDIPIHVETIQVTDLTTNISTLRVKTPQFEMGMGGGGIMLTPQLSADFCKYASVYREAMNTNSAFYRFLCLYKLIESLFARRSDAAKAAKALGQAVKSFDERVPDNREGIVAILKAVYPWRQSWTDQMAIDQIVPPLAKGKRLGHIKQDYLEPIRNGIAHALLKHGEVNTVADQLESIQKVNEWLSFCRVWVRLMLKNEFPNEFAFEMKQVPLAYIGGKWRSV